MRIHHFTLAAVALLALSTRIAAQSGTLGKKECEKAAKIVAKGHPEKKDVHAMSQLMACGSTGAQALADGMAQYQTETDTVALDLFMRPVDGWRDSVLLDAATQLANNPAATVQSRVFAVRHLTRLVNPYFLFQYGNMVAGNDEVRNANGDLVTFAMECPRVMSSALPGHVGTPLPADFRTRIKSTLGALVKNAAVPKPVRNAAQCADFSLNP